MDLRVLSMAVFFLASHIVLIKGSTCLGAEFKQKQRIIPYNL